MTEMWYALNCRCTANPNYSMAIERDWSEPGEYRLKVHADSDKRVTWFMFSWKADDGTPERFEWPFLWDQINEMGWSFLLEIMWGFVRDECWLELS